MGAIYSVVSGKGQSATAHTVHANDSAEAAHKVGKHVGGAKDKTAADTRTSAFTAGDAASNAHVKSNDPSGVVELSGAAKKEEVARHVQGREDGYVK